MIYSGRGQAITSLLQGGLSNVKGGFSDLLARWFGVPAARSCRLAWVLLAGQTQGHSRSRGFC